LGLDEKTDQKFDSFTLPWPVKNANVRAAISALHSAFTEQTNHAAQPPPHQLSAIIHHQSSFHP
jgi:hypothetical protein